MPQNEPQSGERWRNQFGAIYRIISVFDDPYNDPDRFELWSEDPGPLSSHQAVAVLNGRELIHGYQFVDDAPADVYSAQGYMVLRSVVGREDQLMAQLQAIMNQVEPLRIFRRLLEFPGLIVNCAEATGRELQLLAERYNVPIAHRVGEILFEGQGIGPQIEFIRAPGFTAPTDQILRIWNAPPQMFPVEHPTNPPGNQVIGDRDFTLDVHVQPPHSLSFVRLDLTVPDEPHQLRQQPEPGPDINAFQAPPPGSFAARMLAEAQQEEDNLIFQAIDAAVQANSTPPSPAQGFLEWMRNDPLLTTTFRRVFDVTPEQLVGHIGSPNSDVWNDLTWLTGLVLTQVPHARIRPGSGLGYYIAALQETLRVYGIDPDAQIAQRIVVAEAGLEDQIEAMVRAQTPLNQELINQMLRTPRHPTPEIQAFIEEVLRDDGLRTLFFRAFGQHPIDFFAPLEIETPSLLIADIRARMEDARYINGAQAPVGPIGPTGVMGPPPYTQSPLVGFQRLQPTSGADAVRRDYFERPGPFTAALQQTDFTRARIGEVRNWDPPKPPENPSFWDRLNQDD